MSFDAPGTTQQVGNSIGAMLLLNASCQALMQVSVAPSPSPWYATLDAELGQAEDLVVGWRQSGYRWFQQEILGQLAACGAAFVGAQPAIDAQFGRLRQGLDETTRAGLVAALKALEAPVQSMDGAVAGYAARLTAFDEALAVPYARMNASIAQIQAQATDIVQQIAAINAQVAQLQQQVQADRAAIASAESRRTTGIVETIFGVLLAPVTGGVSLILAGIGVGTIAEAQEQVSALESTIAQYQAGIVNDQNDLSADQRQVATLNGLTLSMALARADVASITQALDALRTTWDVLLGEIGNAADNVAQAQDALQAIVAQVWFDAACGAWRAIDAFVATLQATLDGGPPVPNVVPVG